MVGKIWFKFEGVINVCKFQIYCWSLDDDKNFVIDIYFVDMDDCGLMVLDVLIYIKNKIDLILIFCWFCCEGICGLCVMNIDGINMLVCIYGMDEIKGDVKIYLLLYMLVIKDLIFDLIYFYVQYVLIMLWLEIKINCFVKEWKQLIEDCKKLDGLYECVMCVFCLILCLSYWWNSDKYFGLVVLLYVYCWIIDSCDEVIGECLDSFEDLFKFYCCYIIMNCVKICFKGLNLVLVIVYIKKMMIECYV